MPKTVTADFTKEHNLLVGRIEVLSAQYKRRYSNGSAMVYESSYVALGLDEIVDVDTIINRLDVPRQNRFQASNLTIRVKNEGFKWAHGNRTSGIFRADAVASSGYHPYKTEFQILFGYKLPPGSNEQVAMFTGYAIDFVMDSYSGECEIILIGKVERQLQSANAQNVCTTYTNESFGTGDGVTKTFKIKKSLWQVSKIRVATVEKVQSTDYTLQGMDDYDTEAEVTFATAPANGAALDFTGKQWLRDKSVSYLVGAVCDEAGITAGQRSIQEPAYPAVQQSVQQDTQAEWDAATKTDTDSNAQFKPGQIALGKQLTNPGFETGDFTNWTTTLTGNGTVVAQSTTKDAGTYAARLTAATPGGGGGSRICKAQLVYAGTDSVYAEVDLTQGTSGFTDGSIELTAAMAGQPLRLRFLLQTDNGSAKLEHTLNCHQAQVLTFRYHQPAPGIGIPENPVTLQLFIDTVAGHSLTASGTFLTQEIDLLATPAVWGKLLITGTLGGGSQSFKTQVASVSGGPYDALVAAGADGQILSELKRYLKIEGTLSANGGTTDGPIIDKIVAQFQSSSLFVAQANFRGKTGYAAIHRLAEDTDCEFGSKGDGTFFFRPKSVSPVSVMTIDEKAAIEKISRLRQGYQEIKNLGQVTYGDYYFEWGSVAAGEAFPSSRDLYQDQLEAKSVSDLLFANSANLAESIAKLIYNSNYRAKTRMRAHCRTLPQLELGDVITVDFMDSELLRDIVFGDPFQIYAPAFGVSDDVLARSVMCKVVGIIHHLTRGKTELDLEEVLS